MSLLGSIGLAAAERLERSVGPGVALRSYKALLGTTERAVVLPAALGALRCALALGDELELDALAAYWETLREVRGWQALRDQCKALCRESRLREACVLAAAEARRSAHPRAHYLHARVLELAGAEAEAEAAFRLAAADASRSPAVAAAARAWLCDRLVARGAPADELVALAAVDHACAQPRHRLALARAQLQASSRFTRAAALSALEELARGSDARVARAAILTAARHADDLGESLSWVEADRVAAALAAWPEPEQRAAAQARLEGRSARAALDGAGLAPHHRDHVDRARAALQGYGLEPAPAAGDPSAGEQAAEIELANLGLPAVAALVRGAAAEAVDPLAAVTSRLRADRQAAVPRCLWTLALLALRCRDEQAKAAALELLRLLLARATARPPRGFAAYAASARAAGAPDLELLALRRAVAAGEPDADAALAQALLRRAWDAAAERDSGVALALLEEARRLARPG